MEGKFNMCMLGSALECRSYNLFKICDSKAWSLVSREKTEIQVS